MYIKSTWIKSIKILIQHTKTEITVMYNFLKIHNINDKGSGTIM